MATILDVAQLGRRPVPDEGRHYSLRVRLAISLAVLLSLTLIITLDPPQVAFRKLSVEGVLSTLTALALISAFLERAAEVFVTVWRAGAREQLEIKLERLEADGACADNLKDCRLEISCFKHWTRVYALAACAVAGILVSFAGVRALAAVVDAGQIKDDTWHDWLFVAFDVTVTGALLAGGADAIHKVVSVFTVFMDATKSRVKDSG